MAPSVEDTIRTYVAAWNAADDDARRDLLARSFAADGIYVDPAARVRGRAALAVHARGFAARWPGATVEVTSRIDVHGDVACFTWRVTGPDGTALREGIDFVTAGADGLLREVRGFFGPYRAPHPTP